MTGLTRQQAAEAVAALFGTTASHSRSSRTYDPWEVTDNEGKHGALSLTPASAPPIGVGAGSFPQAMTPTKWR